MTDWQKIETAPKDGTVIDLWTKRHFETGIAGRMTNCRWHKPLWDRRLGPFQDDVPPNHRCWCDGGLNAVADPTHWMPLPKPPES